MEKKFYKNPVKIFHKYFLYPMIHWTQFNVCVCDLPIGKFTYISELYLFKKKLFLADLTSKFEKFSPTPEINDLDKATVCCPIENVWFVKVGNRHL